MDKDTKMSLIKDLLAGRLTKKQRRSYADLESVDRELKIQWNESENKAIDFKIKEQIWERVKARCVDRKRNKVLTELRWYFAVASLALLLTIGGFWMNSVRDNINDEFIMVIAQQNQMHVLPDSTKVWMESGSSIKYTKAFNKKREVWLEGNSFFEVYKHEGSFFQVHINKAFIEVKGTCFQIKQTNAEKNEITLFHGKIEFNVESTGEKIIMSPSQKVMYNPNNAQTLVENVMDINWKDGRYNFKETPLPQLISIVNQIYQSNIILEGNSFFEVYKHEGSFFQVHINKAFIEVKGTCFQIKQTNAEKNEITLFHGKIEFNVESTGEKIIMSPSQKVMYNPNNAQTLVENVMDINWKDGRYNFKETPLPQLISIVNQIYQSNIILEGKFTKQSSFTGSIRYDETLDDVIEKLCFSLNLTYKKQNSKIVIYN